MKQPLTVTQSIDSDYMIRSAFERIRQLETELIRLRQQTTMSEKFIWVNQSQKLTRVSLLDILYIMSESNYSRIFMKNGQQFFMSRTLKSWANEVSESDFLRCHRSYLVNKSEIVEINRNAYQVILQNGQIIPVSRRKQKNDMMVTTRTKVPSKNTRCKMHKLTPNATSKK